MSELPSFRLNQKNNLVTIPYTEKSIAHYSEVMQHYFDNDAYPEAMTRYVLTDEVLDDDSVLYPYAHLGIFAPYITDTNLRLEAYPCIREDCRPVIDDIELDLQVVYMEMLKTKIPDYLTNNDGNNKTRYNGTLLPEGIDTSHPLMMLTLAKSVSSTEAMIQREVPIMDLPCTVRPRDGLSKIRHFVDFFLKRTISSNRSEIDALYNSIIVPNRNLI